MTTTTTPRVLSSGTITGDAVKNFKGEKLGDIKDLMIDVHTGRVSYAVLDFGGFLGIGAKFFAVPWNALQLDPEKHCFLLDADKEFLKNAEGFNKDEWPNFADQSWGTRIHSYYNVDPYWI